MNKQDLVERLAEEHELTGRFARELVDSVLDMITGAVQKRKAAASGWTRAPAATRAAKSRQSAAICRRRGRSSVAAKSV